MPKCWHLLTNWHCQYLKRKSVWQQMHTAIMTLTSWTFAKNTHSSYTDMCWWIIFATCAKIFACLRFCKSVLCWFVPLVHFFAFLQNCLQRCALLVVPVLQLNQQKLLGRGEETFEQANQGTIEQHGETRKRVEVALWPSVQTKQIKGEKRGWEWVALWPENGESQHPSVWVYKPNQTNQTKKIKPNQTKPTYPKRPGTQRGKGGFVGKEWEKDPCVELTNQLHKPTQTKPNKTNQAKPNQTKQSPAKPCGN